MWTSRAILQRASPSNDGYGAHGALRGLVDAHFAQQSYAATQAWESCKKRDRQMTRTARKAGTTQSLHLSSSNELRPICKMEALAWTLSQLPQIPIPGWLRSLTLLEGNPLDCTYRVSSGPSDLTLNTY